MAKVTGDPQLFLQRSLASGRIHSAYLFSGAGAETREAALGFARGLVCASADAKPCGACPQCGRSEPGEEIAIDGIPFFELGVERPLVECSDHEPMVPARPPMEGDFHLDVSDRVSPSSPARRRSAG